MITLYWVRINVETGYASIHKTAMGAAGESVTYDSSDYPEDGPYEYYRLSADSEEDAMTRVREFVWTDIRRTWGQWDLDGTLPGG